MKKLSLIAIALLLAACSGGSDAPFPGQDSSPPTPTPPVTTPPVAAVDAFFARVNALVGNQPDGEEAIDIAAVVMTEPEDSEPVPL